MFKRLFNLLFRRKKKGHTVTLPTGEIMAFGESAEEIEAALESYLSERRTQSAHEATALARQRLATMQQPRTVVRPSAPPTPPPMRVPVNFIVAQPGETIEQAERRAKSARKTRFQEERRSNSTDDLLNPANPLSPISPLHTSSFDGGRSHSCSSSHSHHSSHDSSSYDSGSSDSGSSSSGSCD